MPNIVIYLSTKDEAALIAEGHDPKKWVREAVKRALSERDVPSTTGAVGASAHRPVAATPRTADKASRSESDEVKPDWKSGKK